MPLPTDEQLLALSDLGSFKRAQRYVSSDPVDITARSDSQIDALVSGSEDYTVRLRLGNHIAASHCSCPAFAKALFCKHLIATAIVARDASPQPENATGTAAASPTETVPSSTLRSFLDAQPSSRLAAWLTELAEADPAIERRLRLYQSQDSPSELRKAIGRLLRAPRFLDWRASRQFARELDVVEHILNQAALDEAGLQLHEYTLTRLFKVYEQSDDSGGDIAERIRSIAEAYLDRLGRRPRGSNIQRATAILALQRLDQWSFLPTKSIWSSLDESGQAAYSNAVEQDFRALPPSAPSDSPAFRSDRFWPTHRMEALAEARGDTDLLIAIISADLSSGHAYERIVSICEAAGREREATQWAERGLKAHPHWRGMRTLLAKHYQRAGLVQESLQLHWQEFLARPEVTTWQQLRQAAAREWPQYRARALAHVSRREHRLPDGRSEASLRIRLLIAEPDLDAARQVAEQHALSPPLLDELAGHLAAAHPVAAASFLRRSVDATLPRCQPRDYPYLARQIARVLTLAPDPTSEAWVDQIRLDYRARRKFIALLDSTRAS